MNEIVNNIEPNSSFVLCGDYNLEQKVTWIRPNVSDNICVATGLQDEIADAIVDFQSLMNLNQFNHVKNINNRSLDC